MMKVTDKPEKKERIDKKGENFWERIRKAKSDTRLSTNCCFLLSVIDIISLGNETM